jgi:hypothetical protein
LWIALSIKKKVEATFENAFFRKIKKKTPIKTIALRIHRNVKEQLLIDKLKHMGT